LQQRSRAYLFRGDTRRAFETAREAVEKDPGALYLAQHLGDAALAAGEFDAAIVAYRNGLGILARGSGDPAARAKLYGRIGRVEERRGNPDRAYDAYRIALELDPAERRAVERIGAIEQPAGPRDDRH
jgi:tetratricopeptide (TPR) repeat protein